MFIDNYINILLLNTGIGGVKMKRFKTIFIILILFSGLIFGFASTPVVAVSVYSLDYGWENENHGSTDGISGLIEYDHGDVDISNWYIDNSLPINGTKSLWVDSDSTGDVKYEKSYLNLSTSFNFINKFEFWGRFSASTGTVDIVWSFINNDIEVFNITFNNDDMWVYEYVTGKEVIVDNIGTYPSDQFKVECTYVDGNSINISVYNKTMDLQHGEIVSSHVVDDWSTFDRVELLLYNDGPSNEFIKYWFDDFNITTTDASGYETCTGNVISIEKRFNNSLVGYDDTVWFRIYEDYDGMGPVYPYWDINIINSVGSTVQSDVTSSYDFMYDFTPRDYMGLGTYYIRAKLTTASTWDVVCPFTVQEESINPVLEDWQIYTEKYFYDDGEDVDVFYKIPVGYNGHIIVTLNGAYYEQSNNISGNQQTRIFDWFAMGEGNIWGFQLYRYNDTALMNSTSIEVKTGFTDWELFVNNAFETSVFAGDEDTPVIIKYAYEGMDNKLYLSVYNNIIYNSSTFERSWELTDGENSGFITWFPRNYTVGLETFYVVLEYDIDHQLDDGITRIVNVFDKEIIEPVPPPEGEGWYGLPFWVPYLIGIFITLFVTMSPLIIGTYITRNSRIEKINIPPLLYVGFFYMGLITSVVMGFLPSWLPFVILFAMITYFAVTWLAGRQSSVQGE